MSAGISYRNVIVGDSRFLERLQEKESNVVFSRSIDYIYTTFFLVLLTKKTQHISGTLSETGQQSTIEQFNHKER